jgi:hypothetical protein
MTPSSCVQVHRRHEGTRGNFSWNPRRHKAEYSTYQEQNFLLYDILVRLTLQDMDLFTVITQLNEALQFRKETLIFVLLRAVVGRYK